MSRTRALCFTGTAGRATAFSPLTVAFLLSVNGGCGLVGSTPAGGWGKLFLPAGLAGVSRVLAGALDEAPDEVFRILRPPAPPEPKRRGEKAVTEAATTQQAAPPAPTGRVKFGLRGGMLTSGGADVRWTDAVQYGLYLRRVPFEQRKMTFEVALNYVETERPDGFRSSTLYTLHGDVLLGRVGGEGVSVCFLIGAAAIIEDSTNRVTGESFSGLGGGAEAGLSLGAAGGVWELRGVYTQVLATANANSLVSVSFGIAF